MATKTSVGTTNVLSNSSNTLFRAWVQYIEDTLVTTGGWSVTADTGQMTIASATAPGAGNTKVGYRMYRMNDGLGAVVMKLYFGSASTTNNPGIWIGLGTGSNGSGTLTGVMFDDTGSTAATTAATTNSTSSQTFYSSANTGRAVFLLGQQASGTITWVWGIERAKDVNGGDTNDLLLVWLRGDGVGNNSLDRSQYLIHGTAAASQPPQENGGITTVLPISNPGTFGGNAPVGTIIPFNGIAAQPGLNVLIARNTEFTRNTTVSISIYGAFHTYVVPFSTTGITRQGNTPGSGDGQASVMTLIRYE